MCNGYRICACCRCLRLRLVKVGLVPAVALAVFRGVRALGGEARHLLRLRVEVDPEWER